MPSFRFRVYWEDDESVYRDIVIKANQSFLQFHHIILQSFEFDNKHKSTFYRSNDHWQRGREILLEKDNEPRKAAPLFMADTFIGDAIRDTNQKFIYVYDFVKAWTFLVELIHVSKEESIKMNYPACVRKEGLAPSQYGTRGVVYEKLVEMEEKYDLNGDNVDSDAFGEEGGESTEENNQPMDDTEGDTL